MRFTLLLLSLVGSASAQTLLDEFNGYPKGSDGGPSWLPDSVGFEMDGEVYRGDGGSSVWRKAPYASEATFSCEVLIEEVTGRPQDWATTGIAIWRNSRDYWALQFVLAPEGQGGIPGRRPYLEFQEMLNGAWLAQGQEGTRLPATAASGAEFKWELGRPYRFEISLSPQRIEGRILDGEREVGRFGHRLDVPTPAVLEGRPALRANSLRARFDNARYKVVKATEEPKAGGPAVRQRRTPPWQSRQGRKLAEGAGFFRTAQADGRWWLVDPEGKAYFDVGTDHCNYQAHWCEKLGYAPHARFVAQKYGSEDAWAASATDRLKQWGFNTLAAGHSPGTRYRGLAHIAFASFGSGFARLDWICEPINWTGFPNVFSPRWERYCKLVARRMAEEVGKDPWCIGTFLDNELEWYGKQGSLVDEILERPADHTAKQALWKWLLGKHKTVEGVNAALGTHYAGAEGFLKTTTVPPASKALDEAREEFLAVIAEEYFRVATRALREADPDHLVMGCRFAGGAPKAVLPAAGKHNDVFTLNTYPTVDLDAGRVLGVPQQLCEYYELVKKPMIITEWSFPALDSGLPCKSGAGMRVDTQAQKAKCYRIFADMIADLPFMVGYHYFMWVDEPALGIAKTFPEDSNYGLVNERDEPYPEFVAEVTRVNARAFERHDRSLLSGRLEVTLRGREAEVRNATESAARGSLLLGGGGRVKAVDLLLKPGERRRIPSPGPELRFAVLRQWDGSATRVVGESKGKPEVVNAGSDDLENVPVVLDGSSPKVALVERLKPGESWAPETAEAPPKDAATLNLAGGGATWVCERRDGSLFDSVRAGKLELGRLLFACHQQVGGQHQWVETNKVESLTVREFAAGTIVDAVVARTGAGEVVTAVDEAGKAEAARTAPAQFRAGVRAVVLKDRPLALVRPLWVESTDSRPWRFVDAFLFCRPAIGGSPQGDKPGGPDVPNYYLGPVGFWTDEKLGGAFGAVGRPGEWQVRFFLDEGGGNHPDALVEVNRDMKRGERWEAKDVPYLWVFASEDAGGWRELARRYAAAGSLLVSAGNE